MSILNQVYKVDELPQARPPSVIEEAHGSSSDSSMFETLKNLMSGDDRETRASNELPSLSDVGIKDLMPSSSLMQMATAATGLLLEKDPAKQINIIKANTDERVTTQTDEKGNTIVVVGDRMVMLNKPGLTGLDAAQLGADVAAFSPAGKTQGLIAGTLAGAATQAGSEVVTQAAGADSSLTDSLSDIAITGGAFGVFNSISNALGPLAKPIIDTIKKGKEIPDSVRRAISGAAKDAGFNPEDVTEVFVKEAAKSAKAKANPERATATALEKEFDSPILTEGQRSLNQKQLREEDALRAGNRGEGAERIMLDAESTANNRLNQVAGEIQSEIAGEAPLISTRQQAGSALADGVRNAESAAEASVREAYGAVGDAALSPEGYKQLLKATRQSINGLEYVKSDTLTPATKELLSQIKRAEGTLVSAEKMGAKIKPQHIRQIDQIKRTINSFKEAAANPTDKRNIAAMGTAFEGALDDAVIKGLFTGDTEALAALKVARGTAKNYFEKFTAKAISTKTGKIADTEGKFIEKIVNANPTDEEVLNSLFTAGSFNKQAAANMAKKFKSILGEGQEWDQVRQAAFKNMVKTNKKNGQEVISGQQSLKALDDAVTKNGSLMRELFSKEELSKVRRFFLLTKRTQPDLTKSRANPSGSANALIQEGEKMLRNMSFLSPELFTLGILAKGAGVNFTSKGAAKRATRPFKDLVGSNPLAGPAARNLDSITTQQEHKE